MTSDDKQESLLTVAEVAQMLKLNQQTIRNWIDAGSMPAHKIGRRVRIKQSDLDRILRETYAPGNARGPGQQETGPSAQDFWSGQAVGDAEPDPSVVALPPSGTLSPSEGLLTSEAVHPSDGRPRTVSDGDQTFDLAGEN